MKLASDFLRPGTKPEQLVLFGPKSLLFAPTILWTVQVWSPPKLVGQVSDLHRPQTKTSLFWFP